MDDYDDNYLTEYEVWQREDDYQRDVWLGIQMEWEAEDEARKA